MTPRGGKRKGAGRPRRTDTKSLPIWCGQIEQEDRELILSCLTPVERFQVLMEAAREKTAGNQ